ncbi:hypothetical protein AVEN_180055-1 [Araneus ventricosus]|uniref:Uncharacterized protein n=1 Tax=Araneus ventricosus TaxID=182803 RepID=A0A4Y2LR37_ARAVE|nr:hypothetical protein AVEN_180055-1 [Araneus ventricosus]
MAAVACAQHGVDVIRHHSRHGYGDGVSARYFHKAEGHHGILSGIYGLGYGGYYGVYGDAPYDYDYLNGYYGYDGLGYGLYGYGPYGYYGRYGFPYGYGGYGLGYGGYLGGLGYYGGYF